MAGQGGAAPVVGVDLGGTKILAGVVDADHAILGRAKRPTPAEAGGPAILAAIVACVDQALAEAGVGRERPRRDRDRLARPARPGRPA